MRGVALAWACALAVLLALPAAGFVRQARASRAGTRKCAIVQDVEDVRPVLLRPGKAIAAVAAVITIASALWFPAPANAYDVVNVDLNDPKRLVLGLRELTYLSDNWLRKTTLCNFGEFTSELLQADKKEELFAAASKAAFWDYDKTATMNVKCKKDPQVVRAFAGLTNDNLLLKNADKLMSRPEIVDRIDPDDIEKYFESVEAFTLAVAEVDQLSYAARTDYGSTETFSAPSKEASTPLLDASGAVIVAKSTFLDQSRLAVDKMRVSLAYVVAALKLE